MLRPGDPAVSARRDVLDTPEAGSIAIRGGIVRVGGYAAGALLSVVSAAVLLRHLGVAQTGSYITVLALSAVVAGLTDLGLSALGARELTIRSGAERAHAMRTLLGMRVLATSTGIVVAVAFAAAVGYAPVLVAGTAIASVGVLLGGIQLQLATSLQSTMRLGTLTVVELGRQVLSCVLIVIAVVLGAGLLTFVALTTVCALATLVVTAWLVRGDVPMHPSFELSALRSLLRETGVFSAAVAAHVLYFRAAIIAVSLLATAEQLGNFAAAYRVVDVLIVLPVLAVSSAFPILARAARDDATRLAYGISRLFDAALVLGAWIALVLGLGAPITIAIVAGPDFALAADVLTVQSAVLATAFVGAVLGYAMLALGLYRAALVVNASAFMVGTVLVVVLVRTYGAIGGAAATVAGELVLILLSIGALAHHDRAVLPSWRVVPRVVVAATLAVAPAVLLGLPPAAAVVVGSAIYLAVALALGAVPKELFVELSRRRGQTASHSP
jgi:O-antigen/teichoic acid export membrane protein